MEISLTYYAPCKLCGEVIETLTPIFAMCDECEEREKRITE